MRKALKVIKTSIKIGDADIPVKVYFERRGDVRFSLTGTGAFLRFPYSTPQKIVDQELQRFKKWVRKTAQNKPSVMDRLIKPSYTDGDILKVGRRSYRLSIIYEDRKTYSASISEGTIFLKLIKDAAKANTQKATRQLISRCVGNDFLPEITKRVHHYNDRYFNQPINSIRFKLNQSNWGSCSVKGNINLSTRLLFAPDDVIDYVIVHELAHRIEFNHSPKFWKIVGDVVPDFKVHERWLKENGHLCQF